MQIPLQITFHNIDPSPAIEANILEHAAKLERFFDRIIRCRVVVDVPHKHKHKGKLYDIRIDIAVPGEEIAISHVGPQDQAKQDIQVSISEAFNAAVRKLEDHSRRFRGDIKIHTEEPLRCKVIKIFPEDAYGFIEDKEGREIYFHKNSLTDINFEDLTIGTEVQAIVSFDQNEKSPRALSIKPVNKV